MNVAHSHNLPLSCYYGTDVIVCNDEEEEEEEEEEVAAFVPNLLHAESSSCSKIMLCILCSLKRHLNIFLVLSIESYSFHWERREMHAIFWLENLKERNHSEDVGIDGRIIWIGPKGNRLERCRLASGSR
jgi:hypothetical protein